jgi:hypothetical protein
MSGITRAKAVRPDHLRKVFAAGVGTLFLFILPLLAQENGGPPAPDNASVPMASDATGPAPSEAGSVPGSGITFQTFYDSLSGLGTWIQSNDYGYIWQPNVNDPNWAPYTNGHWVYTDDGWTWVSDEAWGWATYHYGRWVNLDGIGWAWVPGYTWAPAWVSWRYGDDNAGWAPLPPDSLVGVDYAEGDSDPDADFHIGGDSDDYYDIGAGWYIFLPIRFFGYRDYRPYYCHRNDNYALINHTRNVTNINVSRNRTGAGGTNPNLAGVRHVTTGGPSLAQVNAVSQTPVPTVDLVRTNRLGGAGLANNSLAVYAPHVNPGTGAQPTMVGTSIGMTGINRGTDITQPLVVNGRIAPSPATEAQLQQARIAQDHAPAGAKVVTDATQARPILRAPLTSLTPMTRQINPQGTARSFGGMPNTYNAVPHGAPAYGGAPVTRNYSGIHEEGVPSSHFYQPGTPYSAGPSSYRSRPSTTAGGETEFHPGVRSAPAATSTPATSGGVRSSGEPRSGASYSGGGHAGSVGGNGGSPSSGGGGGGGFQRGH